MVPLQWGTSSRSKDLKVTISLPLSTSRACVDKRAPPTIDSWQHQQVSLLSVCFGGGVYVFKSFGHDVEVASKIID